MNPFRYLTGLLAFCATTAVFAATNEVVVTPKQRIELFDGKSTAGWSFISVTNNAEPAAIWSVKDGVLCCVGKPNGYARTVGAYQHYKLHVEWRWPEGAGNSGIFLHLTAPDKIWPKALEIQLAAGNAGDVRANGGSTVAELTGNSRSVPRRTPGTEKPPGEWNTCDMLCRSNTVTVHVNGVLQNEVTGSSVAAGPIGLQSEGKAIEFRNVVLEPLP